VTTPAIEETRGWREQVLKHFSADIASACRMTVVADPDGLLLDDTVAGALIQAGFDVVLYRDPIDFRFYYESRHRNRWDNGQHSSLVVSATVHRHDLGIVPYDVLTLARSSHRVFEVSLPQLFPTLSCDVLAEIDRSDLDAVWQFTSANEGAPLGQSQTRDLLLRVAFKLSAEMVATPTDLLTQLIRLHQNERIVPTSLATRFAEVLLNRYAFRDWPIFELVVSSDRFYTFLQERWPHYLQSLGAELDAEKPAMPGPERIDFSAPEISAALVDLFKTGRLRPIDVTSPEPFSGRWERVGIRQWSEQGSASSARHAIETAVESAPASDAPAQAWLNFASRWGELSRMVADLDAAARHEVDNDLTLCQRTVDAVFLSWLGERFGTLINRSFLPSPTMVHQAPHYLAHRKKPGDKVALIVVDGMSMGNWLTIKHAAGDMLRNRFRLIEAAAFAWVPTITSVSRQAIFSGHPPMFFEATVQSTAAEERLWRSFWEDRGWRRDRIALIKHQANEHESDLIERVRASMEEDRIECLAIAINSIDRMVHGATPEENVLNATIRTWALNQHLSRLISLCVTAGHDVVVTADHGNVYAKGRGRPNVGSIPDGRGHRALIFPNEVTLEQTRTSAPGTVRWSGTGLPESMHVLIPEHREAFVNQAGTVCTHGGASVDEVLVPFIRVSPL
jgi:hypothetical protein